MKHDSAFKPTPLCGTTYTAVRNKGDAAHAVILSNAKNLAGMPGYFAAREVNLVGPGQGR